MRLNILLQILVGFSVLLATGSASAGDCRTFKFFAYLDAVRYEMNVANCDSFHWVQDRSDADYLPQDQRWTEELDVPTNSTPFDTRSFGKGRFAYESGVLVRTTEDGKYYYSLQKGSVCNWYQDPDTDNIVWSKYPPTDPKHTRDCSRISGRLM